MLYPLSLTITGAVNVTGSGGAGGGGDTGASGGAGGIGGAGGGGGGVISLTDNAG